MGTRYASGQHNSSAPPGILAFRHRRRSLLADVTHELRTPLTVIQGSVEGMIDGVYPADNGQLAALLDETRVLARLIDDLRTLALADSGALLLRKEPTDVGTLVAEELHARGVTLAGTGEVGIGNTTSASALASSNLPATTRMTLSG